MKKASLFIGALILSALVFANVKAFEKNGVPNISLSALKIAMAEDEGGGEGCEKSQGEHMYGTYCWVTSVNGPAVHQFEFDTFWCTSRCPLGGSNCCYDLEVRQE